MGGSTRRTVMEEVLALFDGSIRRLAQAADVSIPTAYLWAAKGYVPSRESALKLSAALLERGHPFSAARLMALEGALGPEANPDTARRVTRAKSRRSVD